MKAFLGLWKFATNKKMQSYYIAKELYRKNYLNKIVCQEKKKYHVNEFLSEIDLSIVKSPPLFLNLVRKSFFRSISFFNKNIARHYSEILFDNFVAKHIDYTADLFFYDITSGLNSLRKAKEKGMRTIVQEQMAHPVYNRNLIIDECRRFNLGIATELMNSEMAERRIKVLEESDSIIALSTSITKRSLEIFGIPSEKVHVVPLGVDTTVFKPQKVKCIDKFRVLFVGNGTLIKGVPYLLEAWKKLALKDAELIICGIQNDKFLDRYKTDINFRAVGRVPVLDYYKKATLFVLPSLSDAFSRAVLEAMASGLPVIISEGVGARDIIDDEVDGYIVPIRDSDAIAERIDYLFRNRDKIIEMGNSARLKAEQYTWDKYGHETCRVLLDNSNQ